MIICVYSALSSLLSQRILHADVLTDYYEARNSADISARAIEDKFFGPMSVLLAPDDKHKEPRVYPVKKIYFAEPFIVIVPDVNSDDSQMGELSFPVEKILVALSNNSMSIRLNADEYLFFRSEKSRNDLYQEIIRLIGSLKLKQFYLLKMLEVRKPEDYYDHSFESGRLNLIKSNADREYLQLLIHREDLKFFDRLIREYSSEFSFFIDPEKNEEKLVQIRENSEQEPWMTRFNSLATHVLNLLLKRPEMIRQVPVHTLTNFFKQCLLMLGSDDEIIRIMTVIFEDEEGVVLSYLQHQDAVRLGNFSKLLPDSPDFILSSVPGHQAWALAEEQFFKLLRKENDILWLASLYLSLNQTNPAIQGPDSSEMTVDYLMPQNRLTMAVKKQVETLIQLSRFRIYLACWLLSQHCENWIEIFNSAMVENTRPSPEEAAMDFNSPYGRWSAAGSVMESYLKLQRFQGMQDMKFSSVHDNFWKNVTMKLIFNQIDDLYSYLGCEFLSMRVIDFLTAEKISYPDA